jgi:hypothetical protein
MAEASTKEVRANRDSKDQANTTPTSILSTSLVEECDFTLGDLLIILALC